MTIFYAALRMFSKPVALNMFHAPRLARSISTTPKALLTKKELVTILREKGFEKKQAEVAVETVFESITSAVAAGVFFSVVWFK